MNFDPLKSPSLAYVIEQAIWQKKFNLVVMVTGMGIGEHLLSWDEAEESQLLDSINAARMTTVKTWRGFDVRHIESAPPVPVKGFSEIRQFDVFSALDPATRYITQEMMDFVTLRDIPDAELELCFNKNNIGDFLQYSEGNSAVAINTALFPKEDEMRLSLAFRKQMVDEAEPSRSRVAAGIYTMLREPLPGLDKFISYDYLRLVILPDGMLVAVVYEENSYAPFWWSPDNDTNTSQVWFPGNVRFAFDVLLSAIWRDACIVKEAAFTRASSRGYRVSNPNKHQSNVIRLPRMVYKSRWGGAQDREIVDAIAKRAHTVRGHYRLLNEGMKPSEQAKQTAMDFGYAEPPDGYTFIRPHTRGEGEIIREHRRVICKGLQVAKTVLG